MVPSKHFIDGLCLTLIICSLAHRGSTGIFFFSDSQFVVESSLVFHHSVEMLTLILLNQTCPTFANSVDPDQLDSEEANWSGSALFAIKYVNLFQQPGLSNLIGWKW